MAVDVGIGVPMRRASTSGQSMTATTNGYQVRLTTLAISSLPPAFSAGRGQQRHPLGAGSALTWVRYSRGWLGGHLTRIIHER